MYHPERPQTRPRVLLLYGGWEGHAPREGAEYARTHLLPNFDVLMTESLEVLQPEVLREFDLLIPVWTFGELDVNQADALSTAVAEGLGIVAWHGHASAFLNCRKHKLLLGGQFVDHPGGDSVRYLVRFRTDQPLCWNLNDFAITSEQYYVLVDPAVEILATTRIVAEQEPWLSGVEMPVAWTRRWGEGRVFYSSIGHALDDLNHKSIRVLLQRAVVWAQRTSRFEASVNRAGVA